MRRVALSFVPMRNFASNADLFRRARGDWLAGPGSPEFPGSAPLGVHDVFQGGPWKPRRAVQKVCVNGKVLRWSFLGVRDKSSALEQFSCIDTSDSMLTLVVNNCTLWECW